MQFDGSVYTYDAPEDTCKFESFFDMPVKMTHPSDDNQLLKVSKNNKLRDVLDLGEDRVALAFETLENCLIYYQMSFSYGTNKLYLIEL